MLSFLTPLAIAFARLAVAPATTGAEEPRLEITRLGADARELAAETLIDADAIADFVVTDRSVTFELELAGERHELRVELGARGRVLGASIWWLGEAEGVHHYDLAEAMPALMEAGSLDAITVAGGVMSIAAGGVVVPVVATDDAEEEVWGEDEGEDVDGDGDLEWGC